MPQSDNAHSWFRHGDRRPDPDRGLRRVPDRHPGSARARTVPAFRGVAAVLLLAGRRAAADHPRHRRRRGRRGFVGALSPREERGGRGLAPLRPRLRGPEPGDGNARVDRSLAGDSGGRPAGLAPDRRGALPMEAVGESGRRAVDALATRGQSVRLKFALTMSKVFLPAGSWAVTVVPTVLPISA